MNWPSSICPQTQLRTHVHEQKLQDTAYGERFSHCLPVLSPICLGARLTSAAGRSHAESAPDLDADMDEPVFALASRLAVQLPFPAVPQILHAPA